MGWGLWCGVKIRVWGLGLKERDLVLLAALGQRAPAPHVPLCYVLDASIDTKLKRHRYPQFESGPREMLSARRDGIHTIKVDHLPGPQARPLQRYTKSVPGAIS